MKWKATGRKPSDDTQVTFWRLGNECVMWNQSRKVIETFIFEDKPEKVAQKYYMALESTMWATWCGQRFETTQTTNKQCSSPNSLRYIKNTDKNVVKTSQKSKTGNFRWPPLSPNSTPLGLICGDTPKPRFTLTKWSLFVPLKPKCVKNFENTGWYAPLSDEKCLKTALLLYPSWRRPITWFHFSLMNRINFHRLNKRPYVKKTKKRSGFNFNSERKQSHDGTPCMWMLCFCIIFHFKRITFDLILYFLIWTKKNATWTLFIHWMQAEHNLRIIELWRYNL